MIHNEFVRLNARVLMDAGLATHIAPERWVGAALRLPLPLTGRPPPIDQQNSRAVVYETFDHRPVCRAVPRAPRLSGKAGGHSSVWFAQGLQG